MSFSAWQLGYPSRHRAGQADSLAGWRPAGHAWCHTALVCFEHLECFAYRNK